jgi:hypothetical protein
VEYEDDEQEEVKPRRVGEWRAARTVSQYITFELDKEFSIRMTVDRSFNMDSPGLSFSFYGPSGRGNNNGQAHLRRFKFAKIETSKSQDLSLL